MRWKIRFSRNNAGHVLTRMSGHGRRDSGVAFQRSPRPFFRLSDFRGRGRRSGLAGRCCIDLPFDPQNRWRGRRGSVHCPFRGFRRRMVAETTTGAHSTGHSIRRDCCLPAARCPGGPSARLTMATLPDTMPGHGSFLSFFIRCRRSVFAIRYRR